METTANFNQDNSLRVQKFLNILDKITEAKGLNVTQIVNIEELRFLPLGTFGRSWADFLSKNNLQPFTAGSRRKQLHDGVHVLTGYGTDPIGEAEVQAFLLGANFAPINLVLSLGLLRMVYKTSNKYQLTLVKNRLRQAYERGRNSSFDPDNWQPELFWHLPLTRVQEIFSIFENRELGIGVKKSNYK